MAYQGFSANQNPWIKEITEKNRLHLRKLAGMDAKWDSPLADTGKSFPKFGA